MVVPTKLKILRGNPGQYPILPEPEPRITAEVPPPPEWLGKDAAGEWRRLAPELHALGLLTVADLQPMASYCTLFGRWMEAERELSKVGSLTKETADGPVVHPLVRVASHAASDMMAAAIQFGLTPAARRKLTLKDPHKASKFNGFVS